MAGARPRHTALGPGGVTVSNSTALTHPGYDRVPWQLVGLCWLGGAVCLRQRRDCPQLYRRLFVLRCALPPANAISTSQRHSACCQRGVGVQQSSRMQPHHRHWAAEPTLLCRQLLTLLKTFQPPRLTPKGGAQHTACKLGLVAPRTDSPAAIGSLGLLAGHAAQAELHAAVPPQLPQTPPNPPLPPVNPGHPQSKCPPCTPPGCAVCVSRL